MRSLWTTTVVAVTLALSASACGLVEETIGPNNTFGTATSSTTTPGETATTAIPPGTSSTVGGTAPPVRTTSTIPMPDPAVDARLAAYGPWQARPLAPFQDARTLTADSWIEANRIQVSCRPSAEPRTFRAGPFDTFAAFPFTGDLLPGLVVDGSLIEDGDLQVLPLARSPIPLRVDLASAAPTVMVDDPTPSSLQQAVGQLMRDADARLTGLPVVPADISLVQSTASSYEEAILDMGVSLRYDSPGLRASFGSSFEQRKGQERHTVVARLTQPMFSINADRSAKTTPGSYFAPSTDMEDLTRIEGQGRAGSGSPPVLIDSVTYGRIVYLTATTTNASHATDLEAAIAWSYGGLSGDANVDSHYEQILRESEIQIEVLGGNDDSALEAARAALRSGSIGEFMKAVDTTTAKPLELVLRTLDGTKLSVTDEARVFDINCSRSQRDRNVGMQLDLVSSSAVLTVNGQEVRTYKGSNFIDLSGLLRKDTNTRIELHYWPPTCIGGSMTVSFLIDGTASDEWRAAGAWNAWVCDSKSIWNFDYESGRISFVSGTVSRTGA